MNPKPLEPKIVEYVVLVGRSDAPLDDQINEHIKQGWQPYGYLVVVETEFLQAMVKYSAKTKAKK